MSAPVRDRRTAEAEEFIGPLMVEPRAAAEFVRTCLAHALTHLAANPTSRRAHALARSALANNNAYETLTAGDR